MGRRVGGSLMATRELAEIKALEMLQRFAVEAPESELLPLLAASVLTASPSFSGRQMADLIAKVAEAFVLDGNPAAADRLLEACARGFSHHGALQPAADLAEALVGLRGSMRSVAIRGDAA